MSTTAPADPQRITGATAHDRKRLLNLRKQIEHRMTLARHLPDADRLLLEQVLDHGMTLTRLARLLGWNATQVKRRINKLLHHVEDPLFRFMIAHADVLDPVTRRTAELVILRLRSLREASIELDLKLYEVRDHIRTVRTLARA